MDALAIFPPAGGGKLAADLPCLKLPRAGHSRVPRGAELRVGTVGQLTAILHFNLAKPPFVE